MSDPTDQTSEQEPTVEHQVEGRSPLVIRKWPPMPSLPADDPIFSNELLILSPIPLGRPRNIAAQTPGEDAHDEERS